MDNCRPRRPHLLSVVARSAVSSGLSTETEIAYNDAKAGATRPNLVTSSLDRHQRLRERPNVETLPSKTAEGIAKVF